MTPLEFVAVFVIFMVILTAGAYALGLFKSSDD